MRKENFLLHPHGSKTPNLDEFTFGDFNESDLEFVDSKEELSGTEDNDLSKHYRSFFTKSPSASTPAPEYPGSNGKRIAADANLSPIDTAEDKKKQKSNRSKSKTKN